MKSAFFSKILWWLLTLCRLLLFKLLILSIQWSGWREKKFCSSQRVIVAAKTEFLCVWVFVCIRRFTELLSEIHSLRSLRFVSLDLYTTIQLGLYGPSMWGETTAPLRQWSSFQAPLCQDLPFCKGGKDLVFILLLPYIHRTKRFMHCFLYACMGLSSVGKCVGFSLREQWLRR